MTAKSSKKLERCPNCGHTPLRDATITDQFQFETGEEGAVTVEVPDVPVQVCDQCGEQYLGPSAARLQHMAVCRALGLLTPDEIKAIRERLGPTQAEFARLTGIGEATVSRWERGRMLPNRAMDRYLRLLDARPEELRALFRQRCAMPTAISEMICSRLERLESSLQAWEMVGQAFVEKGATIIQAQNEMEKALHEVLREGMERQALLGILATLRSHAEHTADSFGSVLALFKGGGAAGPAIAAQLQETERFLSLVRNLEARVSTPAPPFDESRLPPAPRLKVT